jgi:hypothetical protein
MTDNCAINVFAMEDGVYVASETNFLRRIGVEGLTTMEKVEPALTLYITIPCVAKARLWLAGPCVQPCFGALVVHVNKSDCVRKYERAKF